jgi:hypothetical protein
LTGTETRPTGHWILCPVKVFIIPTFGLKRTVFYWQEGKAQSSELKAEGENRRNRRNVEIVNSVKTVAPVEVVEVVIG